MIPDSDAKIWTIKGKPMHLIPRKKLRMSNVEFLQWADEYCDGECTATPTYLAFEHEAEAKAFDVMYALSQ